jgi:hypothetical protein
MFLTPTRQSSGVPPGRHGVNGDAVPRRPGEQNQQVPTGGNALPDGPGVAVLVVPMPGGVRPPTDALDAMLAWLFRHGAPRTGEVLRRLERHGWTLELPDPAAPTQSELRASARFSRVEQARAAAQPFAGRVDGLMRWTPADPAAEPTTVPVPGAERP